MLVVELRIIEGNDHYTAIQLLYRVHIDHIDVAVTQIALRAEINREVEEVKSVRDIPVHNLQQHFLRKAERERSERRLPVRDVADHQRGTLVLLEIGNINGEQLGARLRDLCLTPCHLHPLVRSVSVLSSYPHCWRKHALRCSLPFCATHTRSWLIGLSRRALEAAHETTPWKKWASTKTAWERIRALRRIDANWLLRAVQPHCSLLLDVQKLIRQRPDEGRRREQEWRRTASEATTCCSTALVID